MQRWYGFVCFSDSATGSYFYPAACLTKRCCLLCLPLLKFSPSLPPFSSVRWSSRWRKQKPSDGRSCRERDRSPTSSTSIPVSPHAAALTHVLVFTGHLPIFLPAEINMGSRGCLLCAKARVGSGAPLEPFISLTVKVGKKNEGYDSKTWLSTLAHTLLLLTQLITYISVRVCVFTCAIPSFPCNQLSPHDSVFPALLSQLGHLNTISDVWFHAMALLSVQTWPEYV